LQAGGGIVVDSNEDDEFLETENKLKSNVVAVEEAERIYAAGSGIFKQKS
jgi:anthranilate synthase component I